MESGGYNIMYTFNLSHAISVKLGCALHEQICETEEID